MFTDPKKYLLEKARENAARIYGNGSNAESEYASHAWHIQAMSEEEAYKAYLHAVYPKPYLGITNQDICKNTSCQQQQSAIMRDRENYVATTQWCIDLIAQRTAAYEASQPTFNMASFAGKVLMGLAEANAAKSQAVAS